MKLRQRYFKGNFKFLSVGPLLDLTFPVSFLGSSMSVLKTITEGNQIFCQDIVKASNPIIITNTETFKHKNSQEFLNYVNIINKVWNGYNVLNSSLYETGVNSLGKFSSLTFKDLSSFSSFYMINVNLNNVANLKKVTESRLINYNSSNKLYNEKLLMNQNFNISSFGSNFLNFKKYLYLPNNVFFEHQESFINAEGLIKRTSKLITRKNMKNDWQLLRKFVKTFNSNFNLSDFKNNSIISYNNNFI